MKTFLATALAFTAMTSASLAQQSAAPASAPPPAAQTAPAIPSPTAVPEVMGPKDAPIAAQDAPPPPPPKGREWADRGHHGHMPPPPPPSKAAHFVVKSGRTMIDIKCADDEPTKVCADVLNQVLDKLSPSANSDQDDDSQY